MIAVGLIYIAALSALVAGIALLLEQVTRAVHWPTRWIWVGAMATMGALGLAAAQPSLLFPRTEVAVTAMVRGASHAAGRVSATAATTAGTATPHRATHHRTLDAFLRSRARLSAILSTLGARFRGWDDGILRVWLVLSAFMAGVVVHAASEARRLRHGLEARVMDGATVLLTENIGPAASGVRVPVILLPRWVLELDASLRDLVLAHEREHLAARDPLMLLVALGALVLVPWLLPLWWSWERLRLAIEIDCDARVLRRHQAVRRYAELLLLMSQRSIPAPMVSRPVMTMAAPLQPRKSHLSRRVLAMTPPRTARSPLQIASVFAGVALLTAAACALPRPRTAEPQPDAHAQLQPSSSQLEQSVREQELACARSVEQRSGGVPALVHLTSVGLRGAAGVADSLTDTLLVYAPGPARVRLGTAAPALLTDTLRLHRFPAMTIDVSKSDVHLLLTGSGKLQVGATVTGGASLGFSGSGRHLILLKGGCGIDIPTALAAAQRAETGS